MQNVKVLCVDQLETSTSPPPPLPGIWTFEDWIFQIPAPSGQNGVQMTYPIVGFVCHNATKEQLSSIPAAFNKDLLKTFFCKPIVHKCYILSLNSSISSKHMFYSC